MKIFRNSIRNHDIFISYRRENGVHLASRIKDYLENRRYSAFMDIEDLKSGRFNEELFKKIEAAKDFVVVLTKDCLERCKNENDWLRLEISHAIKSKKNIIPIFAAEFQMPQKVELPADIQDLLNFSGLSAHNELFEASMNRLCEKYLISRPNLIHRKSVNPLLFFLSIVIIIFLIFYISTTHDKIPVQNSCESSYYDSLIHLNGAQLDHSKIILTTKSCIKSNPENADLHFFLAYFRCLSVLSISNNSAPNSLLDNFPDAICEELDKYFQSKSTSKYKTTANEIKDILYCENGPKYSYNSISMPRISSEEQQKIFFYQKEVISNLYRYFQDKKNISGFQEKKLNDTIKLNNEKSQYKIPEDICESISNLKTNDGKRNLLESLFGYKLDSKNPKHLRILNNLVKQIKTDNNQFGQALDIDLLVIVNKVPLYCRNLNELQEILQNQLFIYEHARKNIIDLFGLKKDATFDNDLLLRQIVIDYESKIKTTFRTKGIRLNLITNKREIINLEYKKCDDIVGLIRTMLDYVTKNGSTPGSTNYDLNKIKSDFFPTGGYNIL